MGGGTTCSLRDGEEVHDADHLVDDRASDDDAARRIRCSPLSQGCSRVRAAAFKASLTHLTRGTFW